MSTHFTAIRGKLGNNDCLVMFINAEELVRNAKLPSDKLWANPNIEEIFQRKLDENRIKHNIVPYLLDEKDRFMGSIILATNKWNKKSFIPIDLDKNEMSIKDNLEVNVGKYRLSTDENLYILDGQHRVRAIAEAINADKELPLNKKSNIAYDSISVILIKHDPKKARKIFTAVNANAKIPTKGQLIITNDNDIVALCARNVINTNVIKVKRIELHQNMLSGTNANFITLNSIANSTHQMLKNLHTTQTKFKSIMRKKLPGSEICEEYKEYTKNFWFELVTELTVWNSAMKCRRNDEKIEIRKKHISLRPVVMESIIEAMANAVNSDEQMTRKEAFDIVNKIPWDRRSVVWQCIMNSKGNVNTKFKRYVTLVVKHVLQNYSNRYAKLLHKTYSRITSKRISRKEYLNQLRLNIENKTMINSEDAENE